MFKPNECTTEYFNIIEVAKASRRSKKNGVYFERHHIIPVSLGGSDHAENLVLLTPQEHFRCHELLVKMTEGRERSKMQLALFRLSHNEQQIELTAETYALLKVGLSEAMSQLKKGKQSNRKGKEPWNKGKIGVSPETSKRISDAKRGEKHQYFGKKLSEDIRQKMSLAKRGKSPINKTELADVQIADIKRMRESMTLQQLSDTTGVSVSVIRRVLRD